MNTIFDSEIRYITDSLKSVDEGEFGHLAEDCKQALADGRKVIATGLGKNVPICEKFVGTMLSLGMPASFMHTNSAVHGDMGMINAGDVVIMLTKSARTAESILLWELLRDWPVKIWLLTFADRGGLADAVENRLTVALEHEGDLWNIVPNNSSILNLIILQKLAMFLARARGISLDDFRRNHPGGNIGEILRRGSQAASDYGRTSDGHA